MFTLKNTARVQRLIKNVIILWCRISNKLFTYPRESDLDDRLYNCVANKILGIEDSQGLCKELDDVQIQDIIITTKKIYSFEIDQALEEFKKLDKNFNEIKNNLSKALDNDREFNNLISESLKDCRRIKKIFTKYRKDSTRIISDYRAEDHKLSLNLIDAIKGIGIYSPIFALIGGYLYIWSFFKWFSFDASPFFSINDYVTASLTQLISAFVYIVIIVAAILISQNERAREPNYVTQRYEKQDRNLIFPIALISIALMIFTGFFYNRPDQLYVGIALICIVILPHFLNRYTKLSITNFIFIFGFIIYVSQILSYSFLQYKAIVDKTIVSSTVLMFKNENMILPVSASFILNNSEYYFYYDHGTKNILIIPKDEVRLVTKTFSKI